MKRKKHMPKIVIKTIAVASFITLNILGGTAWGMWDELDTNTQRRILMTHIDGLPIPLPPLTGGMAKAVFVEILSGLNQQRLHTGGWLDNWPKVNIEATCAACKQDIQTAYNIFVLPHRLSSQNTSNALLQQQNDLLRQQIALLSQNPTPK